MSAVIGFLLPAKLKELKKLSVAFPIGFDDQGEKVSNDWSKATLILVDDAEYEQNEIGAGDGRLALLVQHDGSFWQWSNQETWLKGKGWDPAHIDKFHHGAPRSFWTFACDLLDPSSTREGRASTIKAVSSRYGAQHVFRLLDLWAAYEALAQLDPAKMEKSAFDELPEALRADLSGCPDFGSRLAAAEKVAGKLGLG